MDESTPKVRKPPSGRTTHSPSLFSSDVEVSSCSVRSLSEGPPGVSAHTDPSTVIDWMEHSP